jgi:ribosomal protein S18 acetylase RimI-like enzyme
MIRKLSLNDDLETVAKLIYETDPSLFKALFKSYEKVEPYLIKLIEGSFNAFSHKVIHVYCDDQDHILGLIIYYSQKDKPSNQDFRHIFKGSYALRIGFVSLVLFNILNPAIKNTLYIQNLSVSPHARSHGIGKKLLNHAYEEATFKNIDVVSLDVSLENKKAMRLYLNEGFQLIRKRRLLGLFPLVYWIEKVINY